MKKVKRSRFQLAKSLGWKIEVSLWQSVAEAFFPYLYVLNWFFLLLDLYIYPGFSRRLIVLDPRLMVILTVGIGFFAVIRPTKPNLNLLSNIVLGINRLVVPVCIFFYGLLTITESSTYDNYVFSHYHLHPLYAKYVVMFVLCVLGVDLARHYHRQLFAFLFPKQVFKLFNNWQNYHLFVVVQVLIVLTLVTNAFVTWHTILEYYLFMIREPFASHEAKSDYILGDYRYFSFIKKYTPETAVIAIPPQQTPWLTSGNGGYVRYFEYPRKVPNSNLDLPLPPEADYAMIAKGEWFVDDETLYGWPRATVSAEKIWYFNRETGEVTESSDTVYDPFAPGQRYKWGLIKLKK